MNIMMIGKTLFVELLSSRLEKIIWMVWSDCQKTEINRLKAAQKKGTKINLAGDGKFDSRGVCLT